MKQYSFRSYTHITKFKDGGYVMNWDEVDLMPILKEGWEPFQVLQVGKDFIFFFRKEEV